MRIHAFALAVLAILPRWSVSQQPAQAPRPSLIVVITVDQLRGDYLDRFGPQLTGGLARFHTKGAFFPNALQDHSITETAPGHAAILSGREPARTQIVSNGRGVPDSTTTLIGAKGLGASPRRFNGTTLYDWMVMADSGARALSVSRKDRGAILPIGRADADVYWFADGIFTTSSYYADTLPSWLREFNDSIPYDRLAGSRWDLLLPAAQYAEPDSVTVENSGSDFVFPHILPAAELLRSQLAQYPAMDSVTLALALTGARAIGLGTRPMNGGHAMPDLLSVSLSTTDAIGHAYGPDSRELHDQVLHVDRWLGQFMTALQALVPADRIIYVLTADHGVAPMPELAAPKAHHGGRVWLSGTANEFEQDLENRYHTRFGLEFDNGLLYADIGALRARGIDVDSLARAIVADGVGQAGVKEGFTPASLRTSQDADAARWRRTIPESLGWIAAFVPKDGFVWSPGRPTAEHGTPNALSLSVPIAFIGNRVPPGRYERRIRTVDIAPTLAGLLGVRPTEALDGKILPEILGTEAALPAKKKR